MSEPLKVRGMVLRAAPSGEYDRRTVILTKERGRITAFARGARKPKSPLLASTAPFVFGTLTVYEGREAYTLVQAEIEQYFMDIREDFEKACYGCYFMEVAEYYTRENLDGGPMLNLLYVTLRALQDARLDYELIRCIFEMKAMVQNGEYPYETAEDPSLSEAVRCAIAYVLTAPLQKLYGFTLTPEAFREFRRVQNHFNRYLDRNFKSLDILKTMVETKRE